MKRKVHATAAVLAILCLASFWTSTIVSELFLSIEAVARVKQTILYALFVFIPTIMVTGITGFAMAGKGIHPLILRKKRRMPFIGANGFLVLVPSAIYLAAKATAGDFDSWFYVVQGIELVAGALNITLIGLNISDGIQLGRRRLNRATFDSTSR